MLSRLRLRFRTFADQGASAVEYGLLVAGIAVVILAIVFTLGGTIRESLFATACTDLSVAAGLPSC